MKLSYNAWAAIFLLASVPMAWLLLNRRSAQQPIQVVRFGAVAVELPRDLRGGQSAPARQLAEVVQRCAVDVLLVSGLDDAAATAAVLADEYLAVGQNEQKGLVFAHRYSGPSSAASMALLSRYPIRSDEIRTFSHLHWQAMPSPSRPTAIDDTDWATARLSTHGHWDVPIQLTARGPAVHCLCSAPTSPRRSAAGSQRNHDEIRLWAEYLTAGNDWLRDDAGAVGGLAADARFVVLGDLECDPLDGGGEPGTMAQLLGHARVQDPEPRSAGAALASKEQWGANAGQRGNPALDTCDLPDEPGKDPGNLRLDYVLPSRSLTVVASEVFWPPPRDPAAALLASSTHRLVWLEIAVP
jgi:hypothetical protein